MGTNDYLYLVHHTRKKEKKRRKERSWMLDVQSLKPKLKLLKYPTISFCIPADVMLKDDKKFQSTVYESHALVIA